MTEKLLTPAETALAFRVTTKTLARWAKEGKLAVVKTPGGTRRYRESDVRAMLEATSDLPD